LAVGDGQDVHWEVAGNPAGLPAVVLHGGPGSGASRGSWDWFDLDRYQVVLFDQRGCGQSTPHASDGIPDLSTNTTQSLIADIERLRRHLEISAWVVAGVSWGTTLGLAYAQEHPGHVRGLVLNSTVTTSAAEVEWVTRGMGQYFPDEWARYVGALPPGDHDGNIASAYTRLLMDPDPAVHEPAAAAWCAWEDTHVATHPGHRPSRRFRDPRFRLCFARLVTHYWRHAAFLPEGQILDRMGRLDGIPGALIHGRRDVSSPASVAQAVHHAWPGSQLVVLDGEGHGAGPAATRQATDVMSERAVPRGPSFR
jgi:proline iminopeptidase